MEPLIPMLPTFGDICSVFQKSQGITQIPALGATPAENRFLVTFRNSSCGKVMLLHLSVILSKGGGRVSVSGSRGVYTP